MADRLARELDRWSRRTLYGADDGLVIAHPQSGRPLDRSKLGRRFKVACANAGVRAVRFHDPRQSFATRLAASGQPMRTIQESSATPTRSRPRSTRTMRPARTKVEIVNVVFAEDPVHGIATVRAAERSTDP